MGQLYDRQIHGNKRVVTDNGMGERTRRLFCIHKPVAISRHEHQWKIAGNSLEFFVCLS